jgi:DNA-binding response OmpR family regulator
MSAAVLLAEHEPTIDTHLRMHLIDNGFEVFSKPEDGRPHLVLAGDLDTVEAWSGEVPVIVLGQEEADVVERVRAFQRGCDDYVGRPFHYEELLARIHAVLRRVGHEARRELIEAGPIRVDPLTRGVTVHGHRVVLAQKEFSLLLVLASDPGRVFSKAELLRDVWGYRASARTRTLDSHASRLRRKLRVPELREEIVVNVWGVGYRLLNR